MDLHEELWKAATQQMTRSHREHDSAYDGSTSGRE
jgi:hypothetical protein